MKQTAAAAKIRAKRARRPIYMIVRKLVDPETGELVGALVPSNAIDQRLMRERKFHVNREVRAELKQPRNPAFHRLAHAVGHLMVDNVEGFENLDAHEALKRLQREAGVCCEEQLVDMGTIRFGDVSVPVGQVPVKVPRSLAFDEMEEDEFARFFEGITAHIGARYASVMLDEVKAEFWLMVQGDGR